MARRTRQRRSRGRNPRAPERASADHQLERILYILPAAQGDGVGLSEVEERLGVPRERVVDDLTEVTARQYYHPAGGADHA